MISLQLHPSLILNEGGVLGRLLPDRHDPDRLLPDRHDLDRHDRDPLRAQGDVQDRNELQDPGGAPAQDGEGRLQVPDGVAPDDGSAQTPSVAVDDQSSQP